MISPDRQASIKRFTNTASKALFDLEQELGFDDNDNARRQIYGLRLQLSQIISNLLRDE